MRAGLHGWCELHDRNPRSGESRYYLLLRILLLRTIAVTITILLLLLLYVLTVTIEGSEFWGSGFNGAGFTASFAMKNVGFQI